MSPKEIADLREEARFYIKRGWPSSALRMSESLLLALDEVERLRAGLRTAGGLSIEEAAELVRLRKEVERLRAAAQPKGYRDVRHSGYPHMCRDDHDEVGWRGDQELCPVCRARAEERKRWEGIVGEVQQNARRNWRGEAITACEEILRRANS